MDQYTIFICIGSITSEMKKVCEEKQIEIIEPNPYNTNRLDILNEIAIKLLQQKNIFVTHAQSFITKKLDFCLLYELETRLRSLINHINCRLILDKKISEYYNDEQHQIKRITGLTTLTLPLNEFVSMTLNQIVPVKVNREDMKRIEAIAPYFYFYNLQDLLPSLYNKLQNIRIQDHKSEHIKSWPIVYDESFKAISDDEKYSLLRKVEEKYKDFDEIIFRTSDNMKSSFSESGRSKLYQAGMPGLLHLKHLSFDNGKLRFKIVVEEEGKKSNYFLSAGGFFVPWQK